MKERLTKYSEINKDYITPYCDTQKCNKMCEQCDYEQKIVNRLAEYEDLEEQGLIVRLPCKVGDKVYYISGKKINEKIVTKTEYRIVDNEIDIYCSGIYVNDIYDKQDTYYRCTKFDVSLFTTKAEAEKKLKELKGEE